MRVGCYRPRIWGYKKRTVMSVCINCKHSVVDYDNTRTPAHKVYCVRRSGRSIETTDKHECYRYEPKIELRRDRVE